MRDEKLYLKSKSLLAVGYMLTGASIFIGLFGEKFFLFMGGCMLLSTIVHHKFHNKKYAILGSDEQ